MRPRRRGRGVVGTVATAAVVGGTIGAVQHKQQQKYARQDAEALAQQQAAYDAGQQSTAAEQQQAEMEQMQQQLAVMQAQQAAAATAAPAAATAAPAAAGDDLMSQLNQLAQLHRAGVLDDAEFAAAKAKLLG
jgi:hypothetical protein